MIILPALVFIGCSGKVNTDKEEKIESTSDLTYVMDHFWEKVNFKMPHERVDSDRFEQTFVDYLPLLSLAGDSLRKEGVKNLLQKARQDTAMYEWIVDLAYHYLYDPNSPMLNESLYKPFLEVMVENPFPDETSSLRAAFQLEEVRKNNPGDIAPDFSFETREGLTKNLYDIKASERIMLIFYDPECDHCEDVMDRISNNPEINEDINKGLLTILAVSSGNDRQKWQQKSSYLPSNWIVGYENGDLEDDGRYILRASPTIFLLDANKTILIKDMLIL